MKIINSSGMCVGNKYEERIWLCIFQTSEPITSISSISKPISSSLNKNATFTVLYFLCAPNLLLDFIRYSVSHSVSHYLTCVFNWQGKALFITHLLVISECLLFQLNLRIILEIPSKIPSGSFWKWMESELEANTTLGPLPPSLSYVAFSRTWAHLLGAGHRSLVRCWLVSLWVRCLPGFSQR